ncbi:hypothetical protein E3N88_27219 [Mikania micrantha]|uniref:Uncharacterized protein n=1 Tax=Mikania micrantha TaxID=192012 RepID=A0A5N6MW72_9ASTR|nr:hypothetical protein E3N88_27219 [Mikania micrantha]
MVTSLTAKFRFRDHGDDMENGESAIGDTCSQLSSFTSDEDSDIEFDEVASMTANVYIRFDLQDSSVALL